MVNHRRGLKSVLAISAIVLLATHGAAQQPGQRSVNALEAPVAKLVVSGGSRSSADWYGDGAVEISAPLCIGSSTGAYRLSVLPSSGLAILARSAKLTIYLEQDGVLHASQAFDGHAPVIFTGRTDPNDIDCQGGQNARLILRMPEVALLSVAAGQYFDRFRLEVEAI